MADVCGDLQRGQGGEFTKADDSQLRFFPSALPNIPEIYGTDRKITGLEKARWETVTWSISRRGEGLLLCSVTYSWYGISKSPQPTFS